MNELVALGFFMSAFPSLPSSSSSLLSSFSPLFSSRRVLTLGGSVAVASLRNRRHVTLALFMGVENRRNLANLRRLSFPPCSVTDFLELLAFIPSP